MTFPAPTVQPRQLQPSLLGGTRTAAFVPPGGGAPAPATAAPTGPGGVVSTFTQPPAGGGAMTLQALMARQKEAAARQQANLQQPQGTILGGLGQMTNALFSGLEQNRAAKEEAVGREEIVKAITGIDPNTGIASPEQLATIMRRDPDLGIGMYEQMMQARRDAADQEKWEPIPTPEGENGQWFRSSVSGETKKVGGGSPGEGGWKPSDLGSLRDDYTKAATVYEQSTPAWNSMQETFGRVKDLKVGDTSEGAGVADYALVISLAKIMDPGSVVREGEVETIRKTGGPADALMGLISSLSGGGSLSPAVRRGLMTEANSRVKAQYEQAKKSHDWISGIARRNKILPEDVVPPLAPFAEWNADADNVDPAKAATDDEAYPG